MNNIIDIQNISGIEAVAAFKEAKETISIQTKIRNAVKAKYQDLTKANGGRLIMGIVEGAQVGFTTKPTEYMSKTDLEKALAAEGLNAERIDAVIKAATRKGVSFDAF